MSRPGPGGLRGLLELLDELLHLLAGHAGVLLELGSDLAVLEEVLELPQDEVARGGDVGGGASPGIRGRRPGRRRRPGPVIGVGPGGRAGPGWCGPAGPPPPPPDCRLPPRGPPPLSGLGCCDPGPFRWPSFAPGCPGDGPDCRGPRTAIRGVHPPPPAAPRLHHRLPATGWFRALVDFNAELRPRLKKLGLLTRDPRKHERKKYGQKGARKRFQFSKR